MDIREVRTTPIEGQKPGTSGLRARTSVFMQPGYLENFIHLQRMDWELCCEKCLLLVLRVNP